MEEQLARADAEAGAADHHSDVEMDILQAMFGGICSLNVRGPPWFDDVTKKQLSEELVEIGMQGERKNLADFKVYKPATWADWKRLGGRIVPSRWVLREKGAGRELRVKARLVAQEVNTGSWRDSFAGTPSELSLRLVLWTADSKNWRVELGDVTAAFLHAPLPSEPPVFIIPPESERVPVGQAG